MQYPMATYTPEPATTQGAPVGQPLTYGPMQAPSRPQPRNFWSIVAAAAGVFGLVLGGVALIIALIKPSPEPTALAPAVPPPAPAFMFSTEQDKQWCATMRPLLAESLDMTPSTVIGHGPDGIEYQRFSAWVRGWAERMNSTMNDVAAKGSANSWLDRTGRRMTDLTTAVTLINHDGSWARVAGYEFNDAAATGTSINSYCRSIGEPVRP